MVRAVCVRCLREENLQSLIRRRGSRGECGSCGKSNRKVLSIDQVAEYVCASLDEEYDQPENVLPWAEGEFVGVTWETRELLDEIDLDAEDDVLDALANEIGDDRGWCESDINGSEGERLESGWSNFCDVVKTQCRFFLDRAKHDEHWMPTPMQCCLSHYPTGPCSRSVVMPSPRSLGLRAHDGSRASVTESERPGDRA